MLDVLASPTQSPFCLREYLVPELIELASQVLVSVALPKVGRGRGWPSADTFDGCCEQQAQLQVDNFRRSLREIEQVRVDVTCRRRSTIALWIAEAPIRGEEARGSLAELEQHSRLAVARRLYDWQEVPVSGCIGDGTQYHLLELAQGIIGIVVFVVEMVHCARIQQGSHEWLNGKQDTAPYQYSRCDLARSLVLSLERIRPATQSLGRSGWYCHDSTRWHASAKGGIARHCAVRRKPVLRREGPLHIPAEDDQSWTTTEKWASRRTQFALELRHTELENTE